MKGSMKIQDKTPSLSYQQYIWAAPVSFLLYLTSFIYLFKIFGHASIAFYTIPAVLIGLFLGRKWGLFAGLMFGPVHWVLFSWLKIPILPPDVLGYSAFVFLGYYLICILVAYLVGYLQETRLRYLQALKNRSQVSAALRQSERRYRQLLNHSSNIIVLFDQFGRIEYITPSSENLSGYTPHELIGKHFSELIHPDWRIKANLFYARQIKSKTQKTYYEFPIQGKKGQEIWVANVVELLLDQGQVTGGQGVLIDISSRVKAQQALTKNEERFRSITEQSSDITMIVDQDRIIQYISPSIKNITKFTPDSILNQSFDHFIHPDQQEEMVLLFKKICDSPPGTILKSGPVMGLHQDGHWLYFDSTLTNMMQVNSVNGIVVNVREITQQVEMEKELWQSEYSFRTLFNQANDAVLVITLDGHILEVNQRAVELLGFNSSTLTCKKIQEILDEMEILLFNQTLDKLKQEVQLPLSEWTLKNKNQQSIPVEINFGLIYNNDKELTRIICTIRDISERKKTEEMLRHLATHDPLTKLPNRELFFNRFEDACKHAREGSYSIAVAFIDLDEFKNVNDEYGHATGDDVLKQFSARLKSTIRQHDTIARISGDEFILLFEGVEKADDIERVIQKVKKKIGEPFHSNGHSLHIDASIGISIYPQDGKFPEKIVHLADAAMYEAKKQHKPYFFYHQSQ
jgi:diguanylate cyclase (GGDEF)-like protein/PAS domain S-box-containing protein